MSISAKLVAAYRFPGIARSFSAIGYRKRARYFAELPHDAMRGRRALVTGASSGIGAAIAEALGALGADLILVARSRDKGEGTLRRAEELGGSGSFHQLDLLEPPALRAFAESIADGPLDVVVHNAGALFHEYQELAPGVERTAALHLLAPEFLNRSLAPCLERSADPRVVYVSSGGMYSVALDVSEIRSPARSPFDGVHAYALAKRAQVACAKRWSLAPGPIRAYAMHPGWADTPGVEESLPSFYRATKRWLRTPAEGADTAVWLSAESELSIPSGSFVFDREIAREHILPGTTTSNEEEQALIAWLDRSLEELDLR